MLIRRARPLSIFLNLQRLLLIDTCVCILLSMMLTLTLYLVYRAAQDYTGALIDKLHSISPFIGSVITEADMIINQSLFKAILHIKHTHVLLFGRDVTKPYNFRDIPPHPIEFYHAPLRVGMLPPNTVRAHRYLIGTHTQKLVFQTTVRSLRRSV
jgi:hypothetical protein